MLSDANKTSKRGRKPKESTDIDRFNAPFARNLRELFEKSGETQDSVAAALNTSRQTFGNWLNGRFQPDFDSLARIARHYNVSTDYLLGLSHIKSVDADIQTASIVTGLSEEAVELLKSLRESQLGTEEEKQRGQSVHDTINKFLSSNECIIKFHNAVKYAQKADSLYFNGILKKADQVEALRLWLIHDTLKKVAEIIVNDMCGGADNGKH